MSISINNQSHMQALFKTNTASGVNQVKQPLPAIDNVAAPKPSAMTDIKHLRYISNIKPEEVAAHYESIKTAASKELDETNFENKGFAFSSASSVSSTSSITTTLPSAGEII